MNDKKVVGSKVNLILLEDIGKGVVKGVSIGEVKRLFLQYG